jgi:GNAT superfamily N-acetyltransferase
MSITVRRAVPDDGRVILSLVEALASYEKLAPPDRGAGERLLGDLFSATPRIECYIAEDGGRAVGYAFVLETYSSFLALPTLYLEDLFVLPEARGKKAGYALFTSMVREARSRGCGRMEWTVLDWNELAIRFYRRAGARHMKEWHLYRLVRLFSRVFTPDHPARQDFSDFTHKNIPPGFPHYIREKLRTRYTRGGDNGHTAC